MIFCLDGLCPNILLCVCLCAEWEGGRHREALFYVSFAAPKGWGRGIKTYIDKQSANERSENDVDCCGGQNGFRIYMLVKKKKPRGGG